MQEAVTQVTPETLLAASHEHVAAYGLFCGRAPAGELCDSPELAWGISGVPSPYMNMVVRTRLTPQADVDAAIDSVMTSARRHRVPVGWFLLPGSTPAGIGSSLLAHDFKFEGDDPGMAIDLQRLPDTLPSREGLRIVEVLDLPTLKQWVSAWGDSYAADDEERQSRFDFRASLGLGSDLPYRSFLACLDDQPVATSELFLGAGVAAVMWVGSVPAMRGKGIGAAITLAPLFEARRLGYRIGALTSSQRGYSVYLKLGFQEMCRIPVYCWSPPR